MIALTFAGLGIAAASFSWRSVLSTDAAAGVGDVHQVKPFQGNSLAGPKPFASEDTPAHWDLTLFDVGTGLSMLLRGPDFTLLYDGGSNDDRDTGPSNRLLSYLDAALGRSGDGRCRTTDRGTYPERPLEHVFLSHPHRDHAALLPDVFRCYRVSHIWDSGARSDSRVYGAFLEAASREPGAIYHSARPAPRSRTIRANRQSYAFASWRRFHEGDTIALGRLARATILSARYTARDVNDASIVVRIDLGRASVLLTGDATAGPRANSWEPPRRGSVEDRLLRSRRAEIDVDVLQVAHHGSRTSSRRRFLDAVTPSWALLSAGPTQYGDVTLPDQDVVDELLRRGVRVLRTDTDDRQCAVRTAKVGRAHDGKPGGCGAARLRLASTGEIVQVAEAGQNPTGE